MQRSNMHLARADHGDKWPNATAPPGNTPRQTEAGGVGNQMLAANALAVQVYCRDATVLAPPPMEKPLLQATVTCVPVVPVSEVVALLDTEKGAQLTAARR